MIHSPILQCSPVHPWSHSHFPSLHTPFLLHSGWQAFWSHRVPVQPSSHRHTPPKQTPWLPQSTRHTSVGDMKMKIMHSDYLLLVNTVLQQMFLMHPSNIINSANNTINLHNLKYALWPSLYCHIAKYTAAHINFASVTNGPATIYNVCKYMFPLHAQNLLIEPQRQRLRGYSKQLNTHVYIYWLEGQQHLTLTRW